MFAFLFPRQKLATATLTVPTPASKFKLRIANAPTSLRLVSCLLGTALGQVVATPNFHAPSSLIESYGICSCFWDPTTLTGQHTH